MLTRLFILLMLSTSSVAAEPPIKDFGFFYEMQHYQNIPNKTEFKIVFDVDEQADVGVQNNHFNSLARFINMHVAHGVPLENIQLALVVHGEASLDLLANAHYRQKFQAENKNQALIDQLLANSTQVFLCGQSATHFGVTNDNKMPGVTLALSAMTAHAQLQQQGYTLNPF